MVIFVHERINSSCFWIELLTCCVFHFPQVWFHKLGTDQSSDICLYHEKDDMFSLDLTKSESKQYLFVGSESKNTRSIMYLDVAKQATGLTVLTPRVYGIDTSASHRGDHFFITRRSDEFYNSELLACPIADTSDMKVLLPHRERYHSIISLLFFFFTLLLFAIDVSFIII